MSVKSEIERINNAKSNIANAISSKGVSVPQGTTLDDMGSLIRSIPQEGGGGVDNMYVVRGIFDVSQVYQPPMNVTLLSGDIAGVYEAKKQGKIIYFHLTTDVGMEIYTPISFFDGFNCFASAGANVVFPGMEDFVYALFFVNMYANNQIQISYNILS